MIVASFNSQKNCIHPIFRTDTSQIYHSVTEKTKISLNIKNEKTINKTAPNHIYFFVMASKFFFLRSLFSFRRAVFRWSRLAEPHINIVHCLCKRRFIQFVGINKLGAKRTNLKYFGLGVCSSCVISHAVCVCVHTWLHGNWTTCFMFTTNSLTIKTSNIKHGIFKRIIVCWQKNRSRFGHEILVSCSFDSFCFRCSYAKRPRDEENMRREVKIWYDCTGFITAWFICWLVIKWNTLAVISIAQWHTIKEKLRETNEGETMTTTTTTTDTSKLICYLKYPMQF